MARQGSGHREPHRCARGARCAEREKTTDRPATCDQCACHGGYDAPCDLPGGCGHLHPETEVWLPAYIATDAGLCRTCTQQAETAVNHLPGDVAELTVLMAANGRTADTGKVRSTPTPPTPIRLAIEALRAEIDESLLAWADMVAEQLGVEFDLEAHRRSRVGHRVQACARLIGPNLPIMLALPESGVPFWDENGEPFFGPDDVRMLACRDGVDGALHLMDLHRRVFVAAGRTKLIHRLGSPCPWCAQRTLTRENGASEVRCESDVCRGRAVPERFYDWLAATVAAEEQRQRSGKVA